MLIQTMVNLRTSATRSNNVHMLEVPEGLGLAATHLFEMIDNGISYLAIPSGSKAMRDMDPDEDFKNLTGRNYDTPKS
jgi:hypothetical protein